MSNSFVKNYTHLIFHVKSTGICIRPADLPRVYAYIGGILKGIDSAPMAIGGTIDHIHILAPLPKSKSIVDFVRIIKSESSRWIKTLDAYYSLFSWQDGYAAFSVSQSLLDVTKNYINNQETHHRNKSFEEEIKAFLGAYEIDYDDRFLF